MAQIFPVNIERLKRIGLEVAWKGDHFQVTPVQTASWIRDAYAALWQQFFSNEAGEILGKNGIGRAAVIKYLRRRFPAFCDIATSSDEDDDETAAGVSDRRIFDLLCALGDFSHIGYGRYIPRETRLVRIAPNWMRIAGALNVPDIELPSEGAKKAAASTIGRVFSDPDGEDLWPRSELSPLMVGTNRLRTLDDWVKPLISAVTEKPSFDLTEAKFFTAKLDGRRAFAGWEEAPRHSGLCLCRLNKSSYLLVKLSSDHSATSTYCEINGDERKIVEHYFRHIWGTGTPAILRRTEEKFELQLKYSLPKQFETELLAASASFQPDPDGVWIKTFTLPEASLPFAATLLSILGIKTPS